MRLDPKSFHEFGVLSMCLIWAVHFSVAKYVLNYLDPITFNASRYIVAALTALMISTLFLSKEVLIVPTKRHLLLSFIGGVCYPAFLINGLNYTTAGNAALIMASGPVWTALFSYKLGNERLVANIWLGLAVALAGTIFVVLGGHNNISGQLFRGDLFIVCSAISWGVFAAGFYAVKPKMDNRQFVVLTMLMGSLVLGIWSIISGDFQKLMTAPHNVLLGLFYSGALSLVLSYWLWYKSSSYLGTSRVAAYSNMVPLFALLIAWVVLGELPTIWQIVGVILILSGVTLARKQNSISVLN